MNEESRVTLSVLTANPGGYVGAVSTHPDLVDTAREELNNEKEMGRIRDFHILRCGSDINIIIAHHLGCGSNILKQIALKTCRACREAAEELKLSPSKDRAGTPAIGPGLTEMEFTERRSEPVAVFMVSRAAPGTWNLPLCRIFADPFNTVGLVTDPVMSAGFAFDVDDLTGGEKTIVRTPSGVYNLLSLAGISSRYVIKGVSRNSDGERAAVISTETVTGEDSTAPRPDNPALIVRCQHGLPAVGDVLESFSLPFLVRGWMARRYCGPLMPVPFYEANLTRFDGPPRIIGAGFQISKGRLIGPHDLFDDPCFDSVRREAERVAEYMRRHGPFQPHFIPVEDERGEGFPALARETKEGSFK